MIPTQTLESFPIFGSNATKVEPGDAKKAAGWQQADVVPAEWMNWEWYKASKGITDLNAGLTNVEKELNTILTCANITPSSCDTCTDQVYKAIMCRINACTSVKASVGDTAGCPLGTAAGAGSAATAARSDHVHALPSCVRDKYSASSSRVIGIGYAGQELTCNQVAAFAAYSTNYETGCYIIKDLPVATAKEILKPSCVSCAALLVDENISLKVQCGDELNAYTNSSRLWINYRCGPGKVSIGSGKADSKLGILEAEILCGTVCGIVDKARNVYYTSGAFAFACIGMYNNQYCYKFYNVCNGTMVFAPLSTQYDDICRVVNIVPKVGVIVEGGCTLQEGTMTASLWAEYQNKRYGGFAVW